MTLNLIHKKLGRKIIFLEDSPSIHSASFLSIVSTMNSMLFAFMFSCNCDIKYLILLFHFSLPLYHKHLFHAITTLHKFWRFFYGCKIVP